MTSDYESIYLYDIVLMTSILSFVPFKYMEVFVLSVIITSWQLSGVSDYMVNAYCGSLDGIFDTLAFFGIIDPNDAQCFQLRASVEAASWLLVAASLILAASSHFVLTASSQKLLDDYIPSERRRHNDRWSSVESAEVAGKNEGPKESKNERIPELSPIPPRFTDYYSLATRKEHLFGEDDEVAASSASGGPKDDEIGTTSSNGQVQREQKASSIEDVSNAQSEIAMEAEVNV